MEKGKIEYVCVSDKKGTSKQAVDSAELVVDSGIKDDAHAGFGHRQISLLDIKDIQGMEKDGLNYTPGIFGENLVVSGLDLSDLGIGTELKIGHACLKITQVGKLCHERCKIFYRVGDCIMPRLGRFAEVLEGSTIKAGDDIEVISHKDNTVVQAAVFTISDRCSRGEATDTAGPAVIDILKSKLGANIVEQDIIPDDEKLIESKLMASVSRRLDLAVTVGGTGFGPRDVTPEATKKVIEREAPGLAEAMRLASSKITPHAWLQRGECGIREKTLVINLPGSKKASSENLEAIIDVLPHAIELIRGENPH